MRGTDRKRCSLPALAAVPLALLLAAPGVAETVTLRWRYAAPERVAGFRVHVGTAGAGGRSIDVGRPIPDAAGVYRASVEVTDGETARLSVSAYDAAGTESPRSNEWLRAAAGALGTPGRPQVVDP